MNDVKKYCDVLGIEPMASLEEVKQAYRDAMKAWHPDRFANESERFKKKAEENTKKINEAYEKIKIFLSSTDKKYTKPEDTRTKEDTTRTDTHREHERKKEDSKQKTNRTTPRFINNRNKTITDTRTGLIWSQDANTPSIDVDVRHDTFWLKLYKRLCRRSGEKTWRKARKYIKCLNKFNYLSYNDWRFPTSEELRSLIKSYDKDDLPSSYSSSYYDTPDRACSWLNIMGFTVQSASDDWWSSTPSLLTRGGEIVNLFGGGSVSPSYVWPVRDGVNTHKTTHREHERFINNRNKTITDTRTGLIWSQDASTPSIDLDTWHDFWSKRDERHCLTSGGKKWEKAQKHIACLNKANYLGHNDWRFPTNEEFESLFEMGQKPYHEWLQSVGFTNVQLYYWSTTVLATGSDSAWVNPWGIRIDDGYVKHGLKSDCLYVWPVRGRQKGF
ncbi:MAG: DUF1566 domain-containing protein [Nitrospirae bacterium]|nr:DUF1566 domain-containing protein [Nitrospirota bacterium]